MTKRMWWLCVGLTPTLLVCAVSLLLGGWTPLNGVVLGWSGGVSIMTLILWEKWDD